MKVAEGVAVFELSSDVLGHRGTIYVTMLWDKDNAVLIDTGYPGHGRIILEEIRKTCGSTDTFTTILLTHQDVDHIGGGAELLQTLGRPVAVLCHRDDAPYVRGECRLIKMTDASIDAIVASLPESVPAERKAGLRKALENPPRMPVTGELAGDTELAMCGGITMVSTPGHTPGHMCVYHRPSRTMITGDCLWLENGELRMPISALCSNPEQANHSLSALARFDIERMVVYHGGLVTDHVNERVRRLADLAVS